MKDDQTIRLSALSVRQPWATLIVGGFKDIENRSWPTTHRGPLLTHASSTVDIAAYDAPVVKGLRYPTSLIASPTVGALLGLVEVVDCVRGYPSPWAEDGLWNWVLANCRRFAEPVPMKGHLSLWKADIPMSLLGTLL